jgi:hypothetical protein
LFFLFYFQFNAKGDVNQACDWKNSTKCPCWMSYANCPDGPIKSTGPLEVRVHCKINNIAALDVDIQTIKIDAYIWLSWEMCKEFPEGVTPYPHSTTIFRNGIDLWGFTSSQSRGQECKDGYAFSEEKFEATFSQKMKFDRYPKDSHNIVMTIEDNEYHSNVLYYTFVPSNVEHLRYTLPGWIVNAEINYTNEIAYDIQIENGSYSSLSFGVSISRPASVYLIKIIPVIIVEIICFVGFWIDIRKSYDTRMGTASGSLLAAIFLQLTLQDNLPRGIELTLMDYHYIITYIFILFVIIETTILKILDKKLEEQEVPELDKVVINGPNLNQSDNSQEIELDENSHDSSAVRPTILIQKLRRKFDKIDTVSFLLAIILCSVVNLLLATS